LRSQLAIHYFATENKFGKSFKNILKLKRAKTL
jgi:hypothetical protein